LNRLLLISGEDEGLGFPSYPEKPSLELWENEPAVV